MLVPLFITAWVLYSLIGVMDQSLLLLPHQWRPRTLIGFDIPGTGAVLTLIIILITGIIATNIFGQRIIAWWELLFTRVPVVKSIYSSVKQVSDTILSDSSNAFRQAVLVQFPHSEAWTVAFITGEPSDHVSQHLDGDFVSVYVPTTPNPTSGYFILLPKSKIRYLDMSVDAALKYIISMGTVSPKSKKLSDKML